MLNVAKSTLKHSSGASLARFTSSRARSSRPSFVRRYSSANSVKETETLPFWKNPMIVGGTATVVGIGVYVAQKDSNEKAMKEERRRTKEAQELATRQQTRVEEVEEKLKTAEEKLNAVQVRHSEEKKLHEEEKAKHKAERQARREKRKEEKKKRKEEKRLAAQRAADALTVEETVAAVETPAEAPAKPAPTGDDDEEEAPVFPTKYAIVGGGPAAFNAMKEILFMEPEAQILIISEDELTPYDRSPMSKELFWQRDLEASEKLTYPNWKGEMFGLEYHERDFYTDESKKITFMSGRKVTDLDAGRHLITLDDGTQFQYEKCLLAVGTSPHSLDVDLPSSTSSVSTFKTAQDFLHLHKTTLDPSVKHITVIGNDYLAADLVDALVIRAKVTESGTKIAQVFPDEGILSSVFPTYYAQHLTERTKSTGVDVRPAVRINSIVETPNSEHKLRISLDDSTSINTDHIVLSLGGTPDVDLAKRAYLEVDEKSGGIVVNAELEARTDLYVAGDAASYYDGYLGRRRVEGIDHAEISGKVAGLNMTGKNKAYTYQPIRWGAVSQNVSYQSVGLIDSSLDTVSVWQKGPNVPLVPSANPDDFGQLIHDPDIAPTTQYEDEKKYERGVIYYMRGPTVVGVMMINVNGQMDVAKRLVTFPRAFDDLTRLRTQIYLGNKPKPEEETVSAPL